MINAGFGGNGAAGKGGVGGSITKLLIADSDFASLFVNSGNAGNGGTGTGGAGGAGGAITSMNITDSDSAAGNTGTFTMRTGDGGSGTKGAGVGGSFTKSIITSANLGLVLSTGNGGNILQGGSGKGGAGGKMDTLQITAQASQNIFPVGASLHAGMGGDGGGTKGAGGVGGSINSVDTSIVLITSGATLPSTITLAAGNGGNGTGGAAGGGGSITSSGAFNDLGDGFLTAGNAGVNGAAPGTGGSIKGASAAKLTGLFAETDLNIHAGNGTHGGAGGSLSNFGYGSTVGANTLNGLPAPTGNITIQAGNGSAAGKFAGAGGSISSVTGSISSNDEGSGPGAVTFIHAGDGGGDPAASKAGVGGSISNLDLTVGGGIDSELQVQAGDAGFQRALGQERREGWERFRDDRGSASGSRSRNDRSLHCGRKWRKWEQQGRSRRRHR